MMDLPLDTCRLEVRSDLGFGWLYSRSADCEECAFQVLANSTAGVLQLKTKYPLILRWRSAGDGELAPFSASDDRNLLCQYEETLFAEYGTYTATLTNDSRCLLEPADGSWPNSSYLPILYSFIFYLCLAIATYGANFGISFLRSKRNLLNGDNESSEIAASTSEKPVKKSGRLASLDTFRGLSIVVMIFVNGGGGGYWFFEHATWDGLLVADLVFPWFIWIMGVCIPIAVTAQLRRKKSKWLVLRGIIRRSVLLFAIGLCLGSRGHPLERLRIPGVLQRFGVCYLVAAALVLFCTPSFKAFETEGFDNFFKTMFVDFQGAWPHWVASVSLLVLHCAITFGMPAPGCPTGYIGPGGLHKNASYPGECIGGAAGYIDKLILSEDHIYNYPTARETYKSGPFDPEGILGSVTSIVQTLLGVQTGITILILRDWKRRIASWLALATVFGIIGGALCNFSQFGGVIPVNKNLWSVSYVLVTSCFALVILTAFYLLIDVYKIWNGAPLIFPGKNSIVMYVGHSLCYNMLPWRWTWGAMNTHDWLYAECLWGTSIWVVIAYWMHVKGIYVAL